MILVHDKRADGENVLKRRMIAFLLLNIFLFAFLINLCCFIDLSVEAVPLWFREGVYVEFRGEFHDVDNYTTLLQFLNLSELRFKDLNFKERGVLFSLFRWECLDFNGSMAELKILLRFFKGDDSFELSTCVFVDVDSRDVYSLDGEFCGKTMLWLPTNLEVGDKVIFGYPECYVEGTVTNKGYNIKTPYGYQKCFEVDFDSNGPVNVTYKNETYRISGLWNWLDYDLDTGILIQTPHFMGEATLYALGGIRRIFSIMLIYETNVDLGPSLIWPQILNIMFFVLPPAVFFVVVFFAVYWRRRKRRRIVRRRER